MTPATTVQRFVCTYVDSQGMRTLMGPAQGRNTYATRAEAQAYLDAVTQNNAADTISSVWGDDPRFEVRECKCWARHHDPVGVYFDEPIAPGPRASVEIIRSKGHKVTVRQQRTGSLRYAVDGGREMTALQMSRRFSHYGL